jgi:Topoisomerase IA
MRHCTPGEYRPKWKNYRMADLPITPDPRFKPSSGARETLATIKKAVESASRVIHAGTPDHPGQYLVDNLIYESGWNGPVERLLTHSLHPGDLSSPTLVPNEPLRWLTEAETCRIHADWLIGINLSRILTLLANQDTPLPAGRVMTVLMELMRLRSRGDQKKACSCIKPALLDTAHLQAACLYSARLSPEKTILAAQSLYETGIISYPFTNQNTVNAALWEKHRQQAVPQELPLSANDLQSGIMLIQTGYGRRLKPDEETVVQCIMNRESRAWRPLPKPHSYQESPLASLYLAMAHATDWAKSSDLNDQQGVQIGTARSRHSTLERIFEAGYAEKSSLLLTDKGLKTLEMVPESAKDPGTFVLWDAAIASVANGTLSSHQFMQRIHSYVIQLVDALQRRKKAC